MGPVWIYNTRSYVFLFTINGTSQFFFIVFCLFEGGWRGKVTSTQITYWKLNLIESKMEIYFPEEARKVAFFQARDLGLLKGWKLTYVM